MRTTDTAIRAAPPIPPPGHAAERSEDPASAAASKASSKPTGSEATESAAGEEDPGSALDTQPARTPAQARSLSKPAQQAERRDDGENLALPPAPAVEDESADPVGDGHSDAELAAATPPAAPLPGTPRPPPGRAQPAGSADDEVPQEDRGDAESHKPGRD